MARKRIQGITIELDGETKGLDKALSDVNKRSRSLQQELRDVDRLLKFDPGNVEALAQKQQLLTQQIENTTERLNRLKSAQSQVEKQFKRGEIGEAQYRAFRREIQYTETQLKKFEKQLAGLDDGKSLDNLKQDLQGVSKEAKETEGAISELGSAIGGLAAGGGIAGAVSQALDSASLKTKIEISMEVPPESVGAVRDSINTVTSYIDDQESAIEGVRRQWALNADASDSANARIVKGAGAIARAYAGIDFTELIQETNEVSRSLNISNDDALGLINSLLKIGFPPEQLDIIAEYGTQLKIAGYDAEEIQAIFAAGVETGSWNIDNLLDGLKEGRIRLAEFGEEVPSAMQDLLDGTNISAQQLQKWGRAVAEGGETGKQAMYEVAQAINGVEDETTKNALGVAVWGTMYEDQGQAVIDTILGAKDQTVDLKENQDQLNDSVKQLDQDPAVQFAQAMQDLKVALAPLLSVIADIISKIAEWVQNNPQLAATIAAIVTAVGIFIGLIAVLGPILTGIGTVVGIVAAAFGVATSTIWIIIGAIVALIAIGAALWTNWDTIKAKAIEVWGAIKEWLAQTWE
ncbi:replication protein, partial [Paludifilum halophilum]